MSLPPGRFMLVTTPNFTGSLPFAKTMGILVVAAFVASTEFTLPVEKITDGSRVTRSSAKSGSRS
jgi:hypothetical protein